MNLDELRTVQSKERQKDSLQNLRPSFYQEVGEYIGDLEDERERAADAADDPFSSPEVGRLTDEIETATDVVEAVYERRMGKLVKQASLAAAGMPADDEGLTAEERDLFEDLVDRIGSNKSRVLDVLEGNGAGTGEAAEADGREDAGVTTVDSEPEPREETSPVPPDGPASDGTEDRRPTRRRAASDEPTADSGATTDDVAPGAERETTVADEPTSEEADETVSAADVMGASPSERPDPGTRSAEPDAVNESDRDGEPTDSRGVDRVTVRITQDVGAILGVDDREYTLSDDDVVTLPEQNATPLVERDAAEPLE